VKCKVCIYYVCDQCMEKLPGNRCPTCRASFLAPPAPNMASMFRALKLLSSANEYFSDAIQIGGQDTEPSEADDPEVPQARRDVRDSLRRLGADSLLQTQSCRVAEVDALVEQAKVQLQLAKRSMVNMPPLMISSEEPLAQCLGNMSCYYWGCCADYTRRAHIKLKEAYERLL
jgi:hypothetical protein